MHRAHLPKETKDKAEWAIDFTIAIGGKLMVLYHNHDAVLHLQSWLGVYAWWTI